MTKLAPEWVRTSDPVIRSPARYRWTAAPATEQLSAWEQIMNDHLTSNGYAQLKKKFHTTGFQYHGQTMVLHLSRSICTQTKASLWFNLVIGIRTDYWTEHETLIHST